MGNSSSVPLGRYFGGTNRAEALSSGTKSHFRAGRSLNGGNEFVPAKSGYTVGLRTEARMTNLELAATLPAGDFASDISPAVDRVQWFVLAGVVAVTSITFGLYWDISWHQTIGRDTFWTPAHLAIHFGGILAAITCTYLIFSTTFAHNAPARAASVGVWGFHGPLGAFLTAWGGATMLTSAPFDNWWHNSFGLDVEILSPPHVVLGLGILGVGVGSLLVLVAQMNRSSGEARKKLGRLFLYLAGLLIVLHLILLSEDCDATAMHSSIFYKMMTFGTPLLLVAFARASGRRWGATIIASIYMAFMLAGLWIFPMFPAVPKLGPVFTNVTHMVPMGFPVLLIFPAIALDVVLNRFADRNRWLQAAIAGSAFLGVLLIVHWPWANFMISPAARNAFFGQNYFPYAFPPSMYHLAWEFQHSDATRGAFLLGLGLAWIFAIVSCRIGLQFGDKLVHLQR
jgi:hypothetical protein